MGRAVLDVERQRRILAMVAEAWHLVNFLVQGASERDVHFLEAPADAQHRDSRQDCLANERQRRSVALRVVQGPRRESRCWASAEASRK